jgi:hypothetical protein
MNPRIYRDVEVKLHLRREGPLYPVSRRLGRPRRSGRVGEEKHAPTGNSTAAVQPVASHFTDWAVQALVLGGWGKVYSEICNTVFILALFVMILGDYKWLLHFLILF